VSKELLLRAVTGTSFFTIRPKSEGCCFQSERLLYGREPNGVGGGTEKAEAVKLPDAGIGPKQWPKKRSGRKRVLSEISENRRQKQT